MSETMTMAKPDEWSWWRGALAGKIDKAGLHDGEPQTGYYRRWSDREQTWEPIAFWYKDGALRCRLNGAEIAEPSARDLWSYACKNPISYEAYQAVGRGESWADVNEAVAGHNRAPVDSSLAAIEDRINDLAREAERMIAAGEAASADLCDQASDVANTLGELEKKADQARAAEKAPHLAESRKIDGKWKPLIERAADIKRRLKLVVVTPFLRKKDEERQRTLAAEIAKGTPADALPTVRTTAGSSKRSTALRPQKSAEVTDYQVLLAHLSEHPEIKEAVQRIANASARAGVALPGMKIIETKVAA